MARVIDVPVLGIVVGALLLPFYALAWLAGYLVLVFASAIFWTVPTLVWLSVIKGVPPIDAVSAASGASEGRPAYTGPFGVSEDSGRFIP